MCRMNLYYMYVYVYEGMNKWYWVFLLMEIGFFFICFKLLKVDFIGVIRV